MEEYILESRVVLRSVERNSCTQ